MKIYQVGGAVRDRLLGRIPNDSDYVVVGLTPDEMLRQGFTEVGKGFPVFLHPLTREEYALARKEIKTGDKHTDFEFIFDESVTLREDLERRDFTCNAIAYDEETGEYIDYFGGQDDIKNKILRHVNAEHFVEDPLRVLRLCRFSAQLDFDAAPATVELCRSMVQKGMLEHLTAERVWIELLKAMKTPAFYRFIELAREVGALKIILPEIEALWKVPERTDFHPEGNTGAHVLHTLKLAENSPLPSIRNLAKDLQVSVITTKRAYDELEKDGYIVTVPAKGCFVAAGNRQAFEQQVYAELKRKMKEASILARQAGITTAELKHILDEVWEELT